jgi:sugar lactone lactonase YvrE
MAGHRISTQSIPRRFLRILGPVAAALAFLVLPLQAWGVYNFTVSKNTFPSTAVGSSVTQTVQVTYNGPVGSPLAITSIVLQSAGAGGTEYTLGAITGCTVDSTGTNKNPGGTVCNISITYTPAFPGSLVSPALSRNATLLVTDGNGNKWALGLAGAATGPLPQLVPGTLARYAGAAYTGTAGNTPFPQDNGLGSTTGAYGGDGGPAVDAQFNFSTTAQIQTQPMAYDSAGNLYVIDTNNYIIRKIDNTSNHNVTTIAGMHGQGGYSGDSGPATSAKLAFPYAITLDAAGDIYFIDNTNIYGSGYVRLRRIDAASGTITAVAGQNYSGTYDATDGGGTCVQSSGVVNCGDGGLATYADLNGVSNMAFDQAGNIYLWGRGVAFIREITVADGKINTIVTAAQLNSTSGGYGGMTLAADGNLYVVVIDNTLNGGQSAAVIKQIKLSTNPVTITNVAGGTWQANYCTFASAQGGFPAADLLIETTGQTGDLASDASGNLYFATSTQIQSCPYAGYPAVYRINPVTQTAYLMADGMDASLNGMATDVAFNAFLGYDETPYSAIPDYAGNLYVMTNNQIAEISGSNSALYMPSGSSGLQDYSTSADQTVTYVNVGNASDTIPSYDLTYETNFHVDGAFPTGSCMAGASLAPSGVCSLNLQFTPTQVGALTDTLSVQNTVPQTVSLTGNGTAYPRIGVSPSSLSFGNQVENTSASQIVTITNTGTATLTVNNLESNGTNLSNFVVAAGGSSPCTITSYAISLTAGSSCTIQVTFTPTAVTSYSAYLQGAANTTVSSSTLISLSQSKLIPFTGTGTAASSGAPAVSLSPSPLIFSPTTVRQGNDLSVTLKNTGTAPLTFTGSTPFTINGGASSPLSYYPSGSCANNVSSSTPLAAGASCTITVQFWPQNAGAYAATLSVADNAANSPQTVAITGIGQAGQLQFIPALLNPYAGVIGLGSGCQDTGNSGPAVNALLCKAYAIAADMNGNIYIADEDMNVVRKVDASGNISDFAGFASESNASGPGCAQQTNSLGDGCPATDATISFPEGVAVDGFGNVYIADTGNKSIRKVNVQTGIITTFLGVTNGSLTFGSNTVNFIPGGMSFDPSGNLYVTDSIADIVLKVDTAGNYTVFAGLMTSQGPQQGYNGDNQPATKAELYLPTGVAADLYGNVYIADSQNNRIRKVDSNGNITTVAGNGTAGNTGDGGPATSAEIYAGGVAVDASGEFYFSTDATSIRKVDLLGNISTIAGGGTGSTGGPAPRASLFDAVNPGIDLAGDVLIPSDSGVASAGPQGDLVFGSQSVGSTSAALPVTLTNSGNAAVYFYNPSKVDSAPGRSASSMAKAQGATSFDSPIGGGIGTITGDFAIASGGTCNFSNGLAAGASCFLNVTFSPTVAGARIGTITLYTDEPFASYTATVQLSGTGVQATTVATPVISPATGTFSNYQTVSITDSTTGATICYTTTTGTTPAASNGSCTAGSTYSGSFSMGAGTNIQAIATLAGSTNSAIASATYTLQAAPPTLTPPGGTYVGAQSVTLSTISTGAQVYYTTNGSTPTGSAPSILYNSGTPISVTTSGTVINAITIDDGFQNSTVSTGTYVLQFPIAALTAPPSFTAVAGATSAAQAATLQNTGNAPLTGIAISITGTNPSDFAIATGTNACGTTLAAASSCSIYVTFTPASTTSFAATLSVADNASGSPQTASLAGTGVAPPSFTVASSTPTQTVQPGGAAAYTINVNSVNGSYTSAVTLAASGLPAGATASFVPPTVTPGSAGGSSVLTIQTVTTTASGAATGFKWPLAVPALCFAGLFFVPGKRRRRWITLGVLLFASLGALTALSACGGGFALPGAASRSYTITVTGTGGAIQQTTTVQLTVE